MPVVNDRPEVGISRSIRLGLAAVPVEVGAAVILLGDEPMVTIEGVGAVTAAGADRTELVATRWADRLGPPVFVVRHRFDLADLTDGDDGLGPMLKREAGITVVESNEAPVDVDTPADLERIARARASRR